MIFKSGKTSTIILVLTLSSIISGYASGPDTLTKKAAARKKTTVALSVGYGMETPSDYYNSYDRERNHQLIPYLTARHVDVMDEQSIDFGAGYKADMFITFNVLKNLGLYLGLGYSRNGIIGDRTEPSIAIRERISFSNYPIRAGISINTRIGNFIPYSNIAFFYAILGPYNDSITYASDDPSSAPSQSSKKVVYSVSARNGIGSECVVGLKYPITNKYGIDLSFSGITATAKIRSTEYKTTESDVPTIIRTIYVGNDSGSYEPYSKYENDTWVYVGYYFGNGYLSFNAIVANLGFYFMF